MPWEISSECVDFMYYDITIYMTDICLFRHTHSAFPPSNKYLTLKSVLPISGLTHSCNSGIFALPITNVMLVVNAV